MSYDDTKSRAVSTHAWFFREGDASIQGTTPTSGKDLAGPGFAGELYLPKADEDNWIGGGDIETWEETMAQDEEKEVRRPLPGALVRKDIITIFQGMDLRLVTNSLTRLAIEAFNRTSTQLSDVNRQFVPLTATPRKYWLMLARYDHENNFIEASNLWVRMKVTGGMKGGGGELVMPEYTCRVLDSALNTKIYGDLSDLIA